MMEKKHNSTKATEYNILIERLIAQYISEGMSEHDARMKAIMSDDSLDMVYPNGYDGDMEAESSDLTQEDMNYFKDKTSTVLILQGLRDELQIQGDALAGYEKQDWDDQAEYVTQGWCEALQFAIKLIERHTNCKP